jgi:hypothetical protein
VAADLSIGIALELAEFNRQFATLGPTAEKEAKLMAAGIRRSLKDAERAAGQSARKIKSDVGGSLRDIEGIASRVLEKMGGGFGDLGDILFDVVGPLSGVSAGFGAAAAAAVQAGAAVAGVYALASAADALAQAAVEASHRLGETNEEIVAYEQGTRDLKAATDELTVSIGSGVAGEVGVLKKALADSIPVLQQWSAAGYELYREVLAGMTLGLTEVVAALETDLYTALTNTTREVLDAEVGMVQYTVSLREASAAAAALSNDMERQAQADEALGAAQQRLADARAKAAQKASDDVKSAADEEAAAWARGMAELEAYGQKSDVVFDAQLKRHQAEQDAIRDTGKALDDVNAKLDEVSADINKKLDEWGDEQKQRTKEALEDLALIVVDTAQQIGDTLMAINQRTIDDYMARIDAGEKLSQAELRELDKAVARQKAASIAQAAASAAVAGVGVAAQLAPALGPFGVAAGVAVGAGLFYASMAAIESESALKFDPWDYMFGGDSGEADQRNLLTNAGDDPSAEDFEGGGKAPQAPDMQGARTSRGGAIRIELDDRLKRLSVTSDTRPGKRPRRR